jgi:23S rRNA (adenine2503-C2)-methyltransferase
MSNLPAALRHRLEEEVPARLEVLTEREADQGATRKGLLRLGASHVIETVVMGYRRRVTVCVSSQSGCAMGCTFCATGLMGLAGNLTAGEIASQVLWANRAARSLPAWTPRRVTNVVFMGMGEPMANYRATSQALDRLMDPAGIGLGARHLTVSTVGVVPGIRRLAVDHPQVGLAVSIHAADDGLRNTLVPANRLWPLATLEKAMREWRDRTGRRPSIEWTLMRGVNDSDEQARLLAPMARRLHAHVNVIPMNPVQDAPFQPSERSRIASFVKVLRASSVPVTVRDTRGREIEAACGQLHSAMARAGTARP